MSAVTCDTARPTRVPGLGYRCDGPNLWRVVDMDTDSSIGPFYRTKAELLADLERYAQEGGWLPAPSTPDSGYRSALQAIAGMQPDADTDHAQLSALCIAIARTALGLEVSR